MLLSTAALEKHKKDFDTFKHQMKLNRIKSYVEDQQSYISQYKSPNGSDISSVPESCENQEPLSSNAFSASISEIIRRKQLRSEETPLSSIHHQQQSSCTRKQPLLHPSSIDGTKRSATLGSIHEKSLTRQKRHKSSSSAYASEKIPPQTKPNIIKKAAHGMHLLQKFVSPNLEISRITIKPSIKQPKLGLFRKGKSSAQGKPIPDITDFNESTINKKDINPFVLDDLSREPPSISRFFSKRPAYQTLHSVSSTHHHSSTIHNNKPKELENSSSVLSGHHARKGSGSSAAQYEAFTNNSFVSIYQLLNECQDMRQYLAHNGHHAVQSYSHVKTPHSIFQTTTTDHSKINTSKLSFPSSNKLPHPLYPHRSPTPHEELSFAPSPHYNVYHYQLQQSIQPPSPPPLQEQDLFAPSWQVVESVASFAANTAAEEHAQLEQEKTDGDEHTTTANDDLELILQSQAMNILGESLQQNDATIQNFWLNQPGFKRGQ